MKKANLLGISKDSIAVIFDVMAEEYGTTHFDIYKNIVLELEPSLPFKLVSYSIQPMHTLIASDEKVFFGLASPHNKYKVYSDFLEMQGIGEDRYLRLVHSTSYIAASAVMEKGIMIEPHVVICSQSHIGFGVFVKRGSSIGHHNSIGAFTDINPGVTLSGKVTIGKCCVIGSGTVVKDNIRIGDNCIIGVGSVVTKDIPDNSIAYGNPCKVMKENTPPLS